MYDFSVSKEKNMLIFSEPKRDKEYHFDLNTCLVENEHMEQVGWGTFMISPCVSFFKDGSNYNRKGELVVPHGRGVKAVSSSINASHLAYLVTNSLFYFQLNTNCSLDSTMSVIHFYDKIVSLNLAGLRLDFSSVSHRVILGYRRMWEEDFKGFAKHLLAADRDLRNGSMLTIAIELIRYEAKKFSEMVLGKFPEEHHATLKSLSAEDYDTLSLASHYLKQGLLDLEGHDGLLRVNCVCTLKRFFSMAKEVGTAPRKDNFLKEYARVFRLFEAKQEKDLADGLKKNQETMRFYAKDGLIVVVPTTQEQFIAEGDAQRNCIADYIKSVAHGDTNVVFIRRADAPNESYITVEVRMQDGEGFALVDARYAFNRRVHSGEIYNFIENYIDYLNQQSFSFF